MGNVPKRSIKSKYYDGLRLTCILRGGTSVRLLLTNFLRTVGKHSCGVVASATSFYS